DRAAGCRPHDPKRGARAGDLRDRRHDWQDHARHGRGRQLRQASGSRERRDNRRQKPGLSSRPLMDRPEHPYLVLPSLSYCETNAQRSLISFSLLMPAKAILVPGIFALGSLMYSLNWASLQLMPEFLLASE